MIVGFVVFLFGLGLGYLAGRQLARQEGSLAERIRFLATATPGAHGSSALERAELEREEEDLLTAGELVARFGLYGQGHTLQQRSTDPAVRDQGL